MNRRRVVIPTSSSAQSPGPDASANLSWRLVRADGRPEEVVRFEESMVEFFLEAAGLLGIPRSVAAIYGICFASAEPLSYSDVRKRLNISSGSISQGLKILREMGAIKIVAAPLDRREFFTPDLELRKLVSRYLEQRVQRQLELGRDRLREITKSIPSGADRAIVLKTRLKSLQGWHDQARAVLPLLRGFLKLGR